MNEHRSEFLSVDQGRRVGSTDTVRIRACITFAELDACVDIQEQVWGYEERDIIPRRLFVVAQRVGGQIFGAFTDSADKEDQMIAFAMALPGFRDGELYLHSHMLAVLPPWRNSGIGRRLKMAQRDDALARGIRRMEWTFDPLEIKNAFFNIHRLGGIVRSYTPNFYGPLHSALQAGLQSDRLHLEWWLDSDRVRHTIAGDTLEPDVAIVESVMVPYQVAHWKNSADERHDAIALQATNREHFLDAFARGLAVVGFRRDAQGNGFYQLGKLDRVEAHTASARATGLSPAAGTGSVPTAPTSRQDL